MTDLRVVFERFDKDKSGFIDVTELDALLRALGAVSSDEDAMLEALSRLACAQPGRVTFDELRSWWEAHGMPATGVTRPEAHEGEEAEDDDRIKAVFERFDSNRNGSIDARELANAAMALGLDVDDDDLDAALERLDRDDDDSLSFAEFVAFVKEHL